MFKSSLVLILGAVILLSGCSGFGLTKRTDGSSSSDGASSRTARSTKHASKTPRNVIGTSASKKDKNASEQTTALAIPTGKTSTPATDDAELRDVVAIVGLGESSSPRSFANEDVVSVSATKGMRQPVIDLGQLSSAPPAKRSSPAIPDRPRLYAFGPTKPGSTLADVADQLLPSERITIAQMMWALYRKNPEAFTNKNINSLKPRSLLNVPELDELLAVSRVEAENQITRLRGSVKTKVSAAY